MKRVKIVATQKRTQLEENHSKIHLVNWQEASNTIGHPIEARSCQSKDAEGFFQQPTTFPVFSCRWPKLFKFWSVLSVLFLLEYGDLMIQNPSQWVHIYIFTQVRSPSDFCLLRILPQSSSCLHGSSGTPSFWQAAANASKVAQRRAASPRSAQRSNTQSLEQKHTFSSNPNVVQWMTLSILFHGLCPKHCSKVILGLFITCILLSLLLLLLLFLESLKVSC